MSKGWQNKAQILLAVACDGLGGTGERGERCQQHVPVPVGVDRGPPSFQRSRKGCAKTCAKASLKTESIFRGQASQGHPLATDLRAEWLKALEFCFESVHETCSAVIILLCSGILMWNNEQPYGSYLFGGFSIRARSKLVVQVGWFWGSFSDLGKRVTRQK